MSQNTSFLETSLLSVKIVTMDYYMGAPIAYFDPTFSETRSHIIKRVPVLRIFGPTPAGQKTCLHLHGIFPYFYVPVPDGTPAGFASKLASGLDKAINLSLAVTSSSLPQVFKVEEVSGIPFYGYHPREHRFFKIFLYNPMYIKRAADMLLNGAVLGLKLQPHESHIPFTQQFMMDYNLQGMNYIHFSSVRFRQGPPASADKGGSEVEMIPTLTTSQTPTRTSQGLTSVEPSKRLFNTGSNVPESLLTSKEVLRDAVSEIEVDAVAPDILNSNELKSSLECGAMNPGLKALWEDERIRRHLTGLEEGLTPPDSPPRAQACFQTDSDKFWRERLREMLASRVKSSLTPETSTFESNPNSTFNFNLNSILSPDSDKIYAAETPDDLQLPNATMVENHVLGLSNLVSQSERAKLQKTINRVSFDSGSEDTKVDEDMIATQRDKYNASSQMSSSHSYLLDEDDKDLIDILADLGAQKLDNDNNLAKILTQSSKKSQDRMQEDSEETLEMTTVIDDDDDENQSEKSQTQIEFANDDELWGSHDDSFWKKISFSQN